MEKLVLESQERDTLTKSRILLETSRLPAVLYGKETKNVNLDIDYQSFRKVFEKAGYNTIINLQVSGKDVEVLVQDIQYHPVSGNFIHVDFKKIVRGVEITTEVEIKFTGQSEAVKTLGGILVTNKEHVTVKCLPRHLIHELEADLSLLKDFHSKITVADLKPPKEVTILDEPEVLLVTAAAPRAVIEEESAEAETSETIEESAEEKA